MKEIITESFARHIAVCTQTSQALVDTIERAGRMLIETLARGNTVMLCGNGGSAADAQHLAAELTGRYLRIDRRPLPAIALTTDTSALTALGNDFGFEQVFARQILALGRPGDLLIAISTSGNSPNVLAACTAARECRMQAIALTGGTGGRLQQAADLALVIPSESTPQIQEMHILIGHTLCDLVDRHFAP